MSQPRTDEEIVNSTDYNFNLNIDTLLNSSARTRRVMRLQDQNSPRPLARTGRAMRPMRLQGQNPPRPPNSFMIYRRDKSASTEFVGLRAIEKSRIIAKKWKNEANEVKYLFYVMERLARRRHENLYNSHL